MKDAKSRTQYPLGRKRPVAGSSPAIGSFSIADFLVRQGYGGQVGLQKPERGERGEICAFAAVSHSVLFREMNQWLQRMHRLGVREIELEETFARSSGPGGQNVNKVATAVTLRHRPSGISVTVQDSRSQAVNRKLARERLLDAIESAREKHRAAEIAEREKARRRKSPRPAALRQKILEEKRKRGELKKQRAKIEI